MTAEAAGSSETYANDDGQRNKRHRHHPPAHPFDVTSTGMFDNLPTCTFAFDISTAGWLGCCGLFFLRTTRLPLGNIEGPRESMGTAIASLCPACLGASAVLRVETAVAATFPKNAWVGDRMQMVARAIDRFIVLAVEQWRRESKGEPRVVCGCRCTAKKKRAAPRKSQPQKRQNKAVQDYSIQNNGDPPGAQPPNQDSFPPTQAFVGNRMASFENRADQRSNAGHFPPTVRALSAGI